MKPNRCDGLGARQGAVLAASLTVALLAGCGGNSGGGSALSSNGPAEQVKNYGALSTRVVGTAQPPVVSTAAGSSVTGVAGASITYLVQNRSITAPTLDDDTKIVFRSVDDAGIPQLFTVPPDGGAVPQQITAAGLPGKTEPAWSPDGTKIAYVAFDTATNSNQIWHMNVSGGAPVKIPLGAGDKLEPTWSPDSTRIAFSWLKAGNANYHIHTVNLSGTILKQLTFEAYDSLEPTWSPDDSRIAYRAPGNGSGIWVIPATGGSPKKVTDEQSRAVVNPAWSPDGTKIACVSSVSEKNQIFTVPSGGGTLTQVTDDGLAFKSGTTWSPDGSRIAYSAAVDNTQPTSFTQIYTVPSAGGAEFQVTTGNADKSRPSWSPFLVSPPHVPPVTLIGGGGLLGSSAAGFLVGQRGDSVLSALTFDTGAATLESRAAGRVQALTGVESDSPNLLFSLTTNDSLKALRYTNYTESDTPGRVITVPTPTGTTAALASFNAATGKVASVLPYAANRSSGDGVPKVNREAGALVLRGRFLGVFDAATGEDLAPRGASQVTLDPRTGAITSTR